MTATRRVLPRRTVLRGLGAAVSLPFLDAMVPALTAKGDVRPTRLGFVYSPNGFLQRHFFPEAAGGALNVTPILRPLAAFRERMIVVSGLVNHQADALDAGAGPHPRAQSTWLTGVRARRTEGADVQAAKTLDQFAADGLGQTTPLRSLELSLDSNFVSGNCGSGYSCVYTNTLSWRTATTPMFMENNPRVVFERLFGDGANASARAVEIRRNRSMLDSVTQEMAGLSRVLGPHDRAVVGEYLEAVRDVERRLRNTEQRAQSSPAAVERPLGVPESFADYARLMFDLQFLAYQADITRVASFAISREQSNRTYPEVGVPQSHHDISHHQNDPARIELNTRINTYHVSLFAHLVERMHRTPDGDGSLLDHAILMFGCGLGDGDVHDYRNLPTLLIGGGNGLRGGRHLTAKAETPLMNLGLSLLDRVGVEIARIGDSTGRLEGI